jgi:flagellar biosynthesis regulator FlaF
MMENSLEDVKYNKDHIKDLGTSQTSLKSTKSLDKSSTSGSFKNEKIHFKEENHEHDNQKVITDASLKVPHKFITNWRQACDRTKDKTKDLLKRWRTMPEIETENAKKSEESTDKDEQIESCGWSVHVWTTWVDRFSIDSEVDQREDCQLTPTLNNKFSHFFTCLLDHDQDNLISEQDFETLIEVMIHSVHALTERKTIILTGPLFFQK